MCYQQTKMDGCNLFSLKLISCDIWSKRSQLTKKSNQVKSKALFICLFREMWTLHINHSPLAHKTYKSSELCDIPVKSRRNPFKSSSYFHDLQNKQITDVTLSSIFNLALTYQKLILALPITRSLLVSVPHILQVLNITHLIKASRNYDFLSH